MRPSAINRGNHVAAFKPDFAAGLFSFTEVSTGHRHLLEIVGQLFGRV